MSGRSKEGKILLLQGNEALAEGALAAGCRFFAGYPITPASEIAEHMALKLPALGGKRAPSTFDSMLCANCAMP